MLMLVALPPRVDDDYEMAGIMEEACREGWARWAEEQEAVGDPSDIMAKRRAGDYL